MKNNGKIRFFSFALLLLCSTGFVHAYEISIVATRWPPYIDDQSQNGGLLTDIVREAMNRSGYSVAIKYAPWKRVLKRLSDGEEMLALGATYSEKQATKYRYSHPIYQTKVSFIGVSSSDAVPIRQYHSLYDLIPYRVAVLRGGIYSPEFDQADYIRKDFASNIESALDKLHSGRVDLLVADHAAFSYALNKANGRHNKTFSQANDHSDSIAAHFFMQPLLATPKLYLLGSRNTALVKKIMWDFNEGLASIRADGTYNDILARHHFEKPVGYIQ